MDKQLVVLCEIVGGIGIKEACDSVQALADQTGCTHAAAFNGCLLIAYVGGRAEYLYSEARRVMASNWQEPITVHSKPYARREAERVFIVGG